MENGLLCDKPKQKDRKYDISNCNCATFLPGPSDLAEIVKTKLSLFTLGFIASIPQIDTGNLKMDLVPPISKMKRLRKKRATSREAVTRSAPQAANDYENADSKEPCTDVTTKYVHQLESEVERLEDEQERLCKLLLSSTFQNKTLLVEAREKEVRMQLLVEERSQFAESAFQAMFGCRPQSSSRMNELRVVLETTSANQRDLTLSLRDVIVRAEAKISSLFDVVATINSSSKANDGEHRTMMNEVRQLLDGAERNAAAARNKSSSDTAELLQRQFSQFSSRLGEIVARLPESNSIHAVLNSAATRQAEAERVLQDTMSEISKKVNGLCTMVSEVQGNMRTSQDYITNKLEARLEALHHSGVSGSSALPAEKRIDEGLQKAIQHLSAHSLSAVAFLSQRQEQEMALHSSKLDAVWEAVVAALPKAQTKVDVGTENAPTLHEALRQHEKTLPPPPLHSMVVVEKVPPPSLGIAADTGVSSVPVVDDPSVTLPSASDDIELSLSSVSDERKAATKSSSPHPSPKLTQTTSPSTEATKRSDGKEYTKFDEEDSIVLSSAPSLKDDLPQVDMQQGSASKLPSGRETKDPKAGSDTASHNKLKPYSDNGSPGKIKKNQAAKPNAALESLLSLKSTKRK